MISRFKVPFSFLLVALAIAIAFPTAMALAQDTGGSADPAAADPAAAGTSSPDPAADAPSAAPTIQSDKEDYPPGGLVTLTGSSWQPGEVVNIFVNDDVGKTWSRDVDVAADANGAIRDQFNLPDRFVADYSVTATGASGSVARTTFTDAKLTVKANLVGGQKWNLTWSKYEGTGSRPARNCETASLKSGSTEQLQGAGGKEFDATGNDSVKLSASAQTVHNDAQYPQMVFERWTGPNNYTSTAREICITGANGTDRTFVAHYTTAQQNTSLSVSAVSGTFSGSASVSATLKTAAGAAVANKTVSFTLNGSPAGEATTNAFGVATLNNASLVGINAGSYPAGVGARFVGDSSYTGSNGTGSLTVNKANQTITFDTLVFRTVNDPDFQVRATASSGLAVTFASATPSTCAVNDDTVHLVAAGTCTITASQDGNGNYQAATPVHQSFKIEKANQTISFTGPNSVTYGDAPFGPGATATSGGAVSYSVPTTTDVCAIDSATNRVRILAAGTCTVGASQTGNANYNDSTATRDITVDEKELTGGFAAAGKAYDGDASATITDRSVTGKVGSDDVSLTGGTAAFENRNVGPAKTVTATGFALAGDQADNYTLKAGPWTAQTAITPKSLTGSFTAENKTYDGSTDAIILSSELAGKVSGDQVSLSGDTATFDNKNAGTAKTVTVGRGALSGADAGNYTLAQGPWTAQAAITPKSLTGSFAAENKTYDGNASASVASRSLSGTVNGDAVSLSGGNATFADKDVGTGKTVTLTGAALAGGDAGNYNLASVDTARADITAKDITGNFAASNKVYDGNASATVTERSLNGVLSPGGQRDNVSLTGGNASFADKNVDNAKTVTLTGASLDGTDANNYNLTSVGNANADITAKQLTGGFAASDKVYDGNRDAQVASKSLPDVIDGDTVSLDLTNVLFDNKNVGAGKDVSADLALSGAQAGNYSLSSQTTTAKANITAKDITGSFTADNKTYDGNADATVTSRSLSGTVENDTVSLTGGTATFGDKNVGTGKMVTLTGATLAGSDAGNYNLTSVGTAKADITAKGLTVSAAGVNKTYDGTTNATVNLSTNKLEGDQVGAAYTGASFANKNVGDNKAVSVNGISVSGNDAANYNLTNTTTSTTANIAEREITVSAVRDTKIYNGTTGSNGTPQITVGELPSGDTADFGQAFDNKSAGTDKTLIPSGSVTDGNGGANYRVTFVDSTNGTITPLGITGSFTAQNKVYDGNADATVTNRSLSGNIQGDAVSLSGGTATFADKNVGTGKTATLTGASLTGADAGNYNLTSVGNANADITKAALTVTAKSETKTLGATNPTFTATIAGFVGGEDKSVLGGTLAFATNVPNPEQVGQWNITPSGLTSDNYDIRFEKGTLTILYGWKGFLQPINDTAHQTGVQQSKFKLGQTIPVRFSIYNAAGTPVQQAQNPTFTKSANRGACDSTTTLEDPTTLTPTAATEYKYTGGQYLYNWSTKGLPAGEYRIYANLADGTKQYVDICLTR